MEDVLINRYGRTAVTARAATVGKELMVGELLIFHLCIKLDSSTVFFRVFSTSPCRLHKIKHLVTGRCACDCDFPHVRSI